MFHLDDLREIRCHDTERWCKILKKFDSCLESSWKTQNLQFDGLLLSKAYKDLDEKVQKSQVSWYVSWRWRVMQSLKKNWLLVPKLTIGSKNDMRNLVKFSATSGKSENLHFDVLLLSIAYKVSAKNLQKNYLSWNSRMIQTLKKNEFLFEKWHEEFGQFLSQQWKV